jgi:transposase-like protein
MAYANIQKTLYCPKCKSEIKRVVLVNKIGEKWRCEKCKKNITKAITKV